MARNGKKKILIEDVLPLIEKYNGNVSNIARKLKVCRHTVQARIDESSTAQQAVDNAREAIKDTAINSLHERMLKSDTLLIFYLKTQARDRGFVERIEHSGPDGSEIPVKIISGIKMDDI